MRFGRATAGVLLDIDGCVLTGLGRGPVAGAVEAVALLRQPIAPSLLCY